MAVLSSFSGKAFSRLVGLRLHVGQVILQVLQRAAVCW